MPSASVFGAVQTQLPTACPHAPHALRAASARVLQQRFLIRAHEAARPNCCSALRFAVSDPHPQPPSIACAQHRFPDPSIGAQELTSALNLAAANSRLATPKPFAIRRASITLRSTSNASTIMRSSSAPPSKRSGGAIATRCDRSSHSLFENLTTDVTTKELIHTTRWPRATRNPNRA